jgi:hypothetical protein
MPRALAAWTCAFIQSEISFRRVCMVLFICFPAQ